jgi:hypothetical protein
MIQIDLPELASGFLIVEDPSLFDRKPDKNG